MNTRFGKQSVQGQTYQAIRAALVDGVFPPGVKVTNRRLADLVGVSVTPVREALRRLIAEGALVELPNGSVMIPDIEPVAYLEEIGWLLRMTEARLAFRAATALSASDVAYLSTLNSAACEARRTEDARRALALWRDFSFRVFERANAPVLFALVEQLWVRSAPVRRPVFPAFDRASDGRHLTELLIALKARDGAGSALAIADLHCGLSAEIEARAKGQKGPAADAAAAGRGASWGEQAPQ